EVVIAVNTEGDKNYGGLVVLKHGVKGFDFYTLYGHLSVASATQHRIGNTIRVGERIGLLGETSENGNWVPHLHFQILLSLLDQTNDFPGVAYFNQRSVWASICPDPNQLFQSEALMGEIEAPNSAIIAY